MPSRAKRRALKKKEDAAAARQNTKNETLTTASSKENSPAIQTETTDGATAVSPKRVDVLENVLAPDVCDFEDKDYENRTNEAEELMWLHLMYLNWIHKKMMECGFILPADDPALSVLMDNEMISVTPEPCDLDLVTVECSNSNNVVIIDIDVTEDQRIFAQNQENATTIEVKAAEKYQIVEFDEVETAAKNQEPTTSEENKETEKNVSSEAFTATEPAADVVQGPHNVVSTQATTAEVLKQLKPMKKIVQDALSRLNAIDARLHKI